jgi:hypothetical protein
MDVVLVRHPALKHSDQLADFNGASLTPESCFSQSVDEPIYIGVVHKHT